MTTIISGGAGFIGINLIKKILTKNSKIVVLDNFSNSSIEYINRLRSKNIEVIKCDLSNLEDVKKNIERILFKSESNLEIWHLAANSDIASGTNNPMIDLKDTFMTTFNLLEIARIYSINSFYFASSSAVYGDHGSKYIDEDTGPMMPISNYGAMKLASEAQCFSAYESFLDNLRIFRFPNVVGTPATHGVILDFIKKLKNNPNKLHVLGDGSQKKSYLHVDDLVDGMIFISQKNIDRNSNPIFNLGPSRDSVSVKWIAEQVVEKVSPNAKILYGKENRGWIGDVPKFSYKTEKVEKLGWKPKMNSSQSIKKAIEEIFEDFKS